MASTHLYSEALETFQRAVLDRNNDTKTRQLLNEFLLDGRSNFSTPDGAKRAAEKLVTDAGEKYNGIKIGKVEVVPKKWVDAVLGNIDNIVAAGSFVTKNAPESVGMAWFAISLTLHAISNNYSLYALFGKGLTDITEVMIIIVHYDHLYDERNKSGFKVSPLVEKLFRDTVAAYAAVLDFSFSVKKHMSGDSLDKFRHGIKDFFNAQASKFQGKLSAIAELKDKILESSQGAFQDKTIQQFKGVQSAIGQLQQRQSQALELQQEQKQVLSAMLEDFKEFKDLVKRKTPWDFLKEEFMTNKNKLGPIPGSGQTIEKLLATKQAGTCTWILADERYQSWIQSDKGTTLCVTGGPGSGKSILLASLVQQLQATTDGHSPFVNYVSCVADNSSQAAALGEQRLDRVYNTLLYQIYELATIDSDRLSLLEECNQIFRNPKSRKAGQTIGRGTHGDGPPEFVGAMGKLVTTLQRNTVIVIDAVGTLSQKDQVQLYRDLQEIIDNSSSRKVSVLVGCRPDEAFIPKFQSTTACIDMSDGSKVDKEAVLDLLLKDLIGWLDAERQLAKEAVLDKAGPSFSYINDVAWPFLKQPFQRPVSAHLSRLPEDLDESFEQFVCSLSRNYFELLQLSLTWCLLAPRVITVKEVVEAYGGVYTIGEDNGIRPGMDTIEDTYESNASDLEIRQVIDASGPFLMTERTDDGQTIIKMQDARQVKKFCEPLTEIDQVSDKGGSQFCKNCNSAIATPSSLVIDPKIAHFEIALIFLRHLNSPLFQKRFGLLEPARKIDANNELCKNGVVEPTMAVPYQNHETESKADPTADTTEAIETMKSHSETPANVEITEQAKSEAGGDDANDQESEANEDADNDTELSWDDNFDDDDYTKDTTQDSSEAVVTSSLFNDRSELRCEINNWPYHLQEAEKLWPFQERRTSEIWTRFNYDIQEELKEFVKNEEVFFNWQKVWGKSRDPDLAEGKYRPLNLAALLGLSAWVEDLLEHGADIDELSGGCNVAQMSGAFAAFHQNIDLLRLLLTRGANFYEAADDNSSSGLQLWLCYHNSPETVKALVDYEIDFNEKDRNGWTGLHAFAFVGSDVEAFKSIMNPKDPSKRPNINAINNDNETPLHKLLWRRKMPLDLLKAFLAVEGIDVNHDDRYSRRPLYIASNRGSLDAVELLLEANANVADTDDSGWTAMHTAAGGNHVKCLDALLDAHSELEPRDKEGETPLQHAAFSGCRAAAELLVSRGSALNTVDKHNRTPFFDATRCLNGGQETALFLLNELKNAECPARDINKVTKGGRTPLRQASAHGFSRVVKELLECINASGDEGVRATINQGDGKLERTPLHCAALRGDTECVRLLLEHGADATLPDKKGETPLMIAQEQWAERSVDSFEEVLLLLIDHDRKAAIADTELPSIAATRGSVQVLRKLRSLRADLNSIDRFGWTPLAHAKHLGHKDAESFLKHQSSWGGALPSRWVDKRSPPILDRDGLRVTSTTPEPTCIISDKPLPPSVERFYFEINLESLGGQTTIAIGFCTVGARAHEFPGWSPKQRTSLATSWGYHNDDGGHYKDSKNHIPIHACKTYGAGDIVGCGVDLVTHKMWFTKNGEKLDHEFENVRGRLYPILGLWDPSTLTTNFGLQEFKWKDKQFEFTDVTAADSRE